MKASAYCKCGRAMEIKSSIPVVIFALKAFWALHSEAGCGEVTKAEAEQARALREDEEDK